jgi:hypothetical protein
MALARSLMDLVTEAAFRDIDEVDDFVDGGGEDFAVEEVVDKVADG